jgi:DNA-binding NarL/FixJ family response regulator
MGCLFVGRRVGELFTAMAAPVRTLVLDDYPLLGQALAGLLCELCNLQLVGICTKTADAAAVIQREPIDLLILDLERHHQDWEHVAGLLLRQRPNARMVLLTAGAVHLVLPPALAPAVLAVVDKSADLTELLSGIIRWQRVGPVPASLPLGTLNPRELRVFLAMGKGLLNKQIAQQLGLTVATVETYRKSICAKLQLSGVELVRAAVLHRLTMTGVLQKL